MKTIIRPALPALGLVMILLLALLGTAACGGNNAAPNTRGLAGDDTGYDLNDDDNAGDDDNHFDDAADDTADDAADDDDQSDDDAADDASDDDAADDAADDASDDDTQTGSWIDLVFNPDPSTPGQHYYPGAVFTMQVAIYDGGVLQGYTNDYHLNVDSDPSDVEYDIAAGQITFHAVGDYQIVATLNGNGLESGPVDVSIEELPTARIYFTAPARGIFTQDLSIAAAGHCDVQGHACAAVKVNGLSPSQYSGGDFQITVPLAPGLNTLVADALDAQGHHLGDANISVLAGDYVPQGDECWDAVGFRVSRQSLDTVATLAENLIGLLPINLFLFLVNPISLFDIGIADAQMNLSNMHFDPVQVSLYTTDDGLFLHATMTNLTLDVQAQGHLLGIPIPLANGTITATSLAFDAQVILGANPDGTLAVSLTITNTTVNGLDVSSLLGIFNAVPGVGDLINAVVTSLIQSMVPDLIQAPLEQSIADLLSSLNLDMSFQFMGKTLTLDALFQEAGTDIDGILMWLKAKAQVDVPDPTVPEFVGSWKKSGIRPDFGVNIPGTFDTYDFGVGINDDIINQLLYEVYRSGVMKFEFFDPILLNTLTLSVFFPQLLLIAPAAPVIIRLEPMLQPILDVSSSGGSLRTSLEMGDYVMHLIVNHPVQGEIEAFSAGMYLNVPVHVSVDDQNRIVMGMDPTQFDLKISIIDEMYDFNQGLLEQFIPQIISQLIPQLVNLLGVIQIPSFAGVTLEVNSINGIGSLGDFLGFYGTLSLGR